MEVHLHKPGGCLLPGHFLFPIEELVRLEVMLAAVFGLGEAAHLPLHDLFLPVGPVRGQLGCA